MERQNAPKVLFLLLAVAAVLYGRMIYSSFSSSLSFNQPNPTNTSTSNTPPPMLILPYLSADVSIQGAKSSSGSESTSVQQSEPLAEPPSQSSTSPIVQTTPAKPQPSLKTPPSLNDAASLVANLNTGKVYLSDNTDGRWPLASVSKLMTAAVATDVMSPDQKIVITESMTAVDPTESTLRVGDTYTVSDLLRVMLLPSNNVAAESLAEFYGKAAFLAAMNAKAQSWGMTSTYYDDPSGLSAGNQSTANDLFKLAQHIYANYPQILAITRMPTATAFNYSTNNSITVKSINNFAGQADFIGGKTGYTDQADGNLLSIFSYNSQPILIVVLGINDTARFNGTQQLYNWYKENF